MPCGREDVGIEKHPLSSLGIGHAPNSGIQGARIVDYREKASNEFPIPNHGCGLQNRAPLDRGERLSRATVSCDGSMHSDGVPSSRKSLRQRTFYALTNP